MKTQKKPLYWVAKGFISLFMLSCEFFFPQIAQIFAE